MKNTNNFNQVVIKRDIIAELTDFYSIIGYIRVIISVGDTINPTQTYRCLGYFGVIFGNTFII